MILRVLRNAEELLRDHGAHDPGARDKTPLYDADIPEAPVNFGHLEFK